MICSGCTTIYKNQFNAPLGARVSGELRADIKVGDRISGTASNTVVLGFITLGSPDKFAEGVFGAAEGTLPSPLPFMNSKDDLLSASAYNAVTSSGADLIIAPQYFKECHDYIWYKTTKVTVTGYKGTLKGIYGQ